MEAGLALERPRRRHRPDQRLDTCARKSAGDDEPVSPVVSLSAEQTDRLPGQQAERRLHGCGDGAARVLHQNLSGNARDLDGVAVDRPHLGRTDDDHARLLPPEAKIPSRTDSRPALTMWSPARTIAVSSPHAPGRLRAAAIRSFISRTARVSPVNKARETIAWPMFSSSISGIDAIESTLV